MFLKLNNNFKQRIKTASIAGVMLAGLIFGSKFVVNNMPKDNTEDETTYQETSYYGPESSSSDTTNIIIKPDTTVVETTNEPNIIETTNDIIIGTENGMVGIDPKFDPSAHIPNP